MSGAAARRAPGPPARRTQGRRGRARVFERPSNRLTYLDADLDVLKEEGPFRPVLPLVVGYHEAARNASKCAQPIILACGTCASAKVCRHSVGAWLYAQLRQNLPTSTIALDPPINFEVSKEP